MKTDAKRPAPIADLSPTELRLGLVAVLGFTYALSWLALAAPAEEAPRVTPVAAAPAGVTPVASPARRAPPAPVVAAAPARAKGARIRTRSS